MDQAENTWIYWSILTLLKDNVFQHNAEGSIKHLQIEKRRGMEATTFDSIAHHCIPTPSI